MKFIKDIIGEQRSQLADLPPPMAPSQSVAPPLSLDSRHRLDTNDNEGEKLREFINAQSLPDADTVSGTQYIEEDTLDFGSLELSEQTDAATEEELARKNFTDADLDCPWEPGGRDHSLFKRRPTQTQDPLVTRASNEPTVSRTPEVDKSSEEPPTADETGTAPEGSVASEPAHTEQVPPALKPAPHLRRSRDVDQDNPSPPIMASSSGAKRVKTRLLGFNPMENHDPLGVTNDREGTVATSALPVGWIAVTDGPGRGACFTLTAGVSTIGRGSDQNISLDFGDTSISRQQHAAVAYDHEQQRFFVGHGGKTNLVRLNGRPVLATEELHSNDTLRIGETTLRFVGLCGATFDWAELQEDTDDDAGFH